MKPTQLDTIYHFSFKDKDAVQHYLSDPISAVTIYAATDDKVISRATQKKCIKRKRFNKQKLSIRIVLVK